METTETVATKPPAVPQDAPPAPSTHLNPGPSPASSAAESYSRTTDRVILGLSLSVLGLALVLSVRGEEQVIVPIAGRPLPGMCGSRMLLGVECPGCGLTRSFINLAHGLENLGRAGGELVGGDASDANRRLGAARHNIARAWHFNPGGLLLFTIMVAQIPLRSWRLWQARRGRRPPALGWMGRWILWVAAIVLIGQWLIRMGLRAFG